MTPYYRDDAVTIYHGDAREVVPALRLSDVGCLVIDPPYDDPGLLEWSVDCQETESTLVFTDPRYLGRATTLFGPPAWVFTWDTMSSWNLGRRRPLTQTKFALWYGSRDYDRDAVLWGPAPPSRNHPTTKQVPLDGRRLTDLWRESLRWLHHPGAGSGSAGTERFGTRQGDQALRHAKPVGWMQCLIGNTSGGLVLDPFLGSGSSLVAAKYLGRSAIGIDVREEQCEAAANRCRQEVLGLSA